MNATQNRPHQKPAPCVRHGTIQGGLMLVETLSYQFDPLLHRMVDKHKWAMEDAMTVFNDLKRFLYLCAVTDELIAPTEKIDELWHNFILFTRDYNEFCHRRLGRFIHHRPRRRDDQPSGRNLPLETLKLATQVFGTLSSNWHFVLKDGTILTQDSKAVGSSDCTASCCEECSGSTNCQSG